MERQFLMPRQEQWKRKLDELSKGLSDLRDLVRKEPKHIRKFSSMLKKSEELADKLERTKAPIETDDYRVMGLDYFKIYKTKDAARVFRKGLRLARQRRQSYFIKLFSDYLREAQVSDAIKRKYGKHILRR